MNFSGFIARRVAFNSQYSFSRFIIRLAIAATAISVMAMILTIAFAVGFKHAIADKMYGFSGHIRVMHYESEKSDNAEANPILMNDTVLNAIKSDPAVTFVSAYANKDAILKGPESFEGLKLKGVDAGYSFTHMREFLKAGSWIHFPDSGYSNEINISSYTANRLKLKPGDKLFSYFIQPDGGKRVRPLIVAGIFKTGIENYDRVNALVDIRLIQRLNNWTPHDIGGYEIFIKDYEMADSVSSRIFDKLPHNWDSHSVTELYRSIFDWLNLQDTTIIIVIVMMVLVAILNLVTCLIILLLERTHMIGLLKSLGSPDTSIQKIFLYHGALITFGGILIGDFLGLLICWLQKKYGFITLPEDSYFISTAAVKIDWQQVCWVNLGTFVVCFVMLLLPSFFIIRRLT
ncbi:MAG: ABC transporter permease, partial [Bacteroidota bacterium]|nr:ABC transporter permease [Bacteroidota bacterium]